MSTLDSAKKPKGRPAVDSSAINVRMERALIGRVDDFRRTESDLPSRPEAVRRLTSIGLNALPIIHEMLAFFERHGDPADAETQAQIVRLKGIISG